MVLFDERNIRLKMDRSRDARRAGMAAVNGGGLSRRRQRTNSLRDSPEEDGGLEMLETGRLRDRGGKKDRDRDRSSRNKRRRVDRVLHGSNREEGDDTSEDSANEDDEEEEDDPMPVVRPPPPPMPSTPSTASSSLPPNHNSHNHNHNIHNHHHRKSFPPKVVRAPAVWKVADEMIGVSIPRKARTGSGHAGGGGGGGGGSSGAEPVAHRQASTSPARPSPTPTAPISPASSNASVRKKMKQTSEKKNRIQKVAKSPSSVQDIEFEVAEVLFGMTRQISGPSKQEVQKSDSKDANLLPSNEAKSRVSSPNSISIPAAASQSSILPPPNSSSSGAPLPAVVAPKRKRPRPVKYEDESSKSQSNLAVPTESISPRNKMDVETSKIEPPSPKSDKELPSSALDNGSTPADLCLPQDSAAAKDMQQHCSNPESVEQVDLKPLLSPVDVNDRIDANEEPTSSSKQPSKIVVDANRDEASEFKVDKATNSPREEKFKFDLMAPPPGKSSTEVESSADFVVDHSHCRSEEKMGQGVETEKAGEERAERTAKKDAGEAPQEEKMVEKFLLLDMKSKESESKPRPLDLQADADNPDKVGLNSSRQPQKQQPSKLPKVESKPDKVQSASIPLPKAISGWPGGLTPFGYMGQAPSLQAAFAIDGSTGSSKSSQPPQLPSPQPRKRCATHCYIAQNISYHQQLARLNPFWPAAPGGVSIYGAKPYNLNAMPSPDSMLSNPLQAGVPFRNLGSLQDNGGQSLASFGGHSSKDNNSVSNTFLDAPQRKQLVNQQAAQPGSSNNMLHTPALIFPLSQPQQAAAAAVMRSGVPKSGAGSGSAAPASNASNSAAMNSGTSTASASTVSFNFANLSPNEAQQYLAILQNNGYPFPMPTHVGAPPQYRGNPAQSVPIFNGSFYTTQMLYPSHLQPHPHPQPQPQPQQPHPTQQGHQNASNSTGSASSQKVAQQSQRLPVSKPRQQLPHQTRDGDIGGEECPSTADSQLSQAQKNVYGTNFTMPIHPQDFAYMSSAAALGRTGSRGEKESLPASQQPQQQHVPTQAFAMSFPTFNGSGTAPLAGFDFASIAQSQSFLQSLPEAARQGYHQIAAAAAQAAQHKKTHPSGTEDGRMAGDSMNTSVPVDDERKLMSAGKSPGLFSQHSLAFSRPDSDAPRATILSSSAASSVTSLAGVNTSDTHPQQQHHHMMQQLQKQHQQIQMQQQLAPRPKSAASSNNAGVYPDHVSSGSMVTKFPSIGGFPQPLVQGNQPLQWKNSSRMGVVSPPPSQNSASIKSPPSQQLARSGQPTLSSSGHQTQISFGSSTSLKAQPTATASGASISMGSPHASLSKTGGSSPKASTVGKTGSQSTTLPTQQQPQQSKSSQSSSSRKSSPGNSRNMPSILGHPNAAHVAQNSSANAHQQQQLPRHPIPPAQFFFSGPYVQQVQSPQANAALGVAGYYHRRLDQQQQQQGSSPQQQQPNSKSSPTSTPSLGHLTGRTATSDPAKAAAASAANNAKGFPPQANLLQPAHFATPGSHPLMSGPVGFPYVHAIPSVSVKSTADQKPAAGNDNLRACWQPEKR